MIYCSDRLFHQSINESVCEALPHGTSQGTNIIQKELQLDHRDKFEHYIFYSYGKSSCLMTMRIGLNFDFLLKRF